MKNQDENQLRAFYCRCLELPLNGCDDLKTWQLKAMFEKQRKHQEKQNFERNERTYFL